MLTPLEIELVDLVGSDTKLFVKDVNGNIIFSNTNFQNNTLDLSNPLE